MTEDVRVVALPSEEPARVWVAIKGMGCEGVGLVDCGMEPPGKYLRCRAVRDQGKLVRSCWKVVQGREQLEVVEDCSCTKLRPEEALKRWCWASPSRCLHVCMLLVREKKAMGS